MFQCPKCNEVIGDKIANCPFCHYEIKLADVRRARQQEEEFIEEATNKMIASWKRRKIGVLFLYLGWLVSTIALEAVFYWCGLELEGVVLSLILPIFGMIYISKKTGAGRCPYCERIIYQRGTFWIDKHCPKCGGKLK